MMGIRFFGQIVPQVDVKKSTKEIEDYMKGFTVDALRDWVIAGTNVVPVWSGAAKATFLKAARQAKVQLNIGPIVAPIGSRIPLGEAESDFQLIATLPHYGWDWESWLAHIGIVDDRVKFLQVADAAVKRKGDPKLPDPVVKKDE